MKKVLVISLCLLFITSIFAFEKGTKNIGGSVSYQSVKVNSDADAMTTLQFAPHGGYFFIDNLCGDLLIRYSSIKFSEDYKMSEFAFGIGGRYFYNNIYGGVGFLMESLTEEFTGGDAKMSGNYLNFQLGYLVGLVENVYIDLGFDYAMGMGKYGGDLADLDIDNEETCLNFGVGLDIFFK